MEYATSLGVIISKKVLPFSLSTNFLIVFSPWRYLTYFPMNLQTGLRSEGFLSLLMYATGPLASLSGSGIIDASPEFKSSKMAERELLLVSYIMLMAFTHNGISQGNSPY